MGVTMVGIFSIQDLFKIQNLLHEYSVYIQNEKWQTFLRFLIWEWPVKVLIRLIRCNFESTFLIYELSLSKILVREKPKIPITNSAKNAKIEKNGQDQDSEHRSEGNQSTWVYRSCYQ